MPPSFKLSQGCWGGQTGSACLVWRHHACPLTFSRMHTLLHPTSVIAPHLHSQAHNTPRTSSPWTSPGVSVAPLTTLPPQDHCPATSHSARACLPVLTLRQPQPRDDPLVPRAVGARTWGWRKTCLARSLPADAVLQNSPPSPLSCLLLPLLTSPPEGSTWTCVGASGSSRMNPRPLLRGLSVLRRPTRLWTPPSMSFIPGVGPFEERKPEEDEYSTCDSD